VLSTPDASVGGQSANPLTDIDTAELLRREEAADLLRSAGVPGAGSVEYREGKAEVPTDAGVETVTLLGTETELRTFEGAVEAGDGPRALVAHVARVTGEDHVAAIGVHHWPIGSTAGTFDSASPDRFSPTVTDLQWPRRYVGRAVGALER
jgi:hypothetical protein